MSESMNLEGLVIPPQREPDKVSFDTRPKFIAKWIAHLPMANLGQTSRIVFKAVVEINRLQLPSQDRFNSLEALREPCQYIIDSLEKRFSGRPLPLNEKNRKISELARALTSELALGYKILTRELASSSKRPDQNLLLTALYRANNYLGLLLLRSYQVYTPYPKNVWRELHTIFSYAEQQKLQDSPLKDNMSLLPGSNSTIAKMYNKILMLSLAMPYRLRQGEIDKVCKLLNKLVHLVSQEKIYVVPNIQGLFIVNLREDRPPSYLSLYQGNDFHNCRLLNTNKLAIEMQERIDQSDAELTSIASKDLLRRLVSSWSIMSKRSFSRIPKQESHVEVAFGISAAHHYISGEKPFILDSPESSEPSIQGGQASEFYSIKVDAISDQYTGADVWTSNYTYSTNDPLNAEPGINYLNNQTSHIQSFDYQSIRLAINNVSAGGYCLVSQNDTNFSAHVGDLLAIREYSDKSIDQWGISVIRRMISLSEDNIELGIEMLTPNAIAVAIRLEGHNDDQCSSEVMRCLMLPELRTIEQPATIITHTLPFKQDSRIRIYLQDKQILATLTRQLEHTRGFSQFEFTIINEDAQEDIVSDKLNNETNSGLEFDTLWSSL